MNKKELVKKWLNNKDNMNWIYKEVDLYLDNNYGAEVQYLYNLVEDTKEELENNYIKLTKKDALILKHQIIKAFEEALILGINHDIEASLGTIKKACKELNYYNIFTTHFIKNLNGEDENIEELKKMFKKYYKKA